MARDIRLSVLVVVGLAAAGELAVSPAATSQPTSLRTSTSQPASTQADSTQPVRRVLLRQDFEGEKGNWGGKILTDKVPAGSTRALGATSTETHWARRASLGNRGTMRAAADTVLTFRYHMSKDIPLTIYVMDRTQKDNLRYDIKKPAVGRWTEVRLNVNRDFRRNDGSAGKLQAGDVLTGISFLAGKTGTDEFDMAVDDVEVISLD